MFSINFLNNYNTFRFHFVIFNNKERKKYNELSSNEQKNVNKTIRKLAADIIKRKF